MGFGFKQIISLFLTGLLLFSCNSILDYKGFIVSYKSVNERFRQSEEWNYEHPAREITIPEDSYSLFIMGDSHVGGTKNLDAFFKGAINSEAEAVVMAGDLTTGKADDYKTFLKHLPPSDTLLSFPLAGNHDLYFDGWKHYHALFGSSTYYFTIKTPGATDLYICLDSGSGTLGNDQLKWFKDILTTKRSGCRHCIVFSHVNLFRSRHVTSTNPPVEELHALMDMAVKHQIDMVITGHDHVRDEEMLGNTVYITLDALLDGCSHASYLNLTLNQGKINYSFDELNY